MTASNLTVSYIRALEYVKNTSGNTTKNGFFEGHEPIGQRLWDGLYPDYIVQDSDGCLWLTAEGAAAIGCGA